MDILNKQLYSKINLIHKYVEKSNQVTKSDVSSFSKFTSGLLSITEQLDEVDTRHILKTSHLIVTDTDPPAKIKAEYIKILADENIINDINIIVKECELILELVTSKVIKNKLNSFIEKYYSSVCCDISDYVQSNEYTICEDCKKYMINDFDTSELICNNCGKIYKLVGTVYNDSINYTADKIKSKSGVFNPNRHYQHWITHILAKESDEELSSPTDKNNCHGEALLGDLRSIIKRDRRILRLLNVNDIRKMLKELKRSDLNKNVPLILKKLTGIGPPIVTDEFSNKVEKLFTRAIEIGEKLMQPSRTNRNYYPYYIYKILDAVIPESNHEYRRILYYIYLQSSTTIIQADKNWKHITEQMSEFEYKITDRSQHLIYAPI